MSSVCTNTFLLPFFVPPSLILFSVRSVFLSISPPFPFFSFLFFSFVFPLTFVRLHFPFPSFCRLVQGFNDCMGEWGCHTPTAPLETPLPESCYGKILIMTTTLRYGWECAEGAEILLFCEGFAKFLIVWEIFVIENDYSRSITRSKTHLTLPPTEIYSLNAVLDHFKIFRIFRLGGHEPPHAPRAGAPASGVVPIGARAHRPPKFCQGCYKILYENAFQNPSHVKLIWEVNCFRKI